MDLLVKLFLILFKIDLVIKRRFVSFYNSRFKTTFDYAYLKFHGVDTQRGYVVLIGLPIIQKYPGSTIKIGNGVTLISNVKGNMAGINHPTIIATCTKDAVIDIEGQCGASGAAIIAANNIKIGKFCGIGANAKIYDTDFHLLNPIERKHQKDIGQANSAPVSIGENVWLNEGCLILKGVSIGEGAVIGPKSVVVNDVLPFQFHSGNPAKFIFDINSKL